MASCTFKRQDAEGKAWQTRLRGMLRERHGQTYGPTTWHAEGKAWPGMRANYVACCGKGMASCTFKRQDAEGGTAWQTRLRDMLRERHGRFHVYVAC